MTLDHDEVLQIILGEYRYWRDLEYTNSEADYIAIGAVGAIANVVSKLSMREHEKVASMARKLSSNSDGQKT